MSYIPTIGLEIHAELKTKSKMFCSCKNDPLEQHPNVNVCPICLGHPGTLPVANEDAINKVIKVGLALGCTIPEHSKFDRKNYFYPDLPKGYQISQYDMPLCKEGILKIGKRDIRITRVHLEEDTGRLAHPAGADYSLVDFNRAGVPLMELVTEPDVTSAKEASAFAQELQLILRYLGASDADMEKGQMRVEANVSIRPGGQEKLGTKVEVKNLNSFRAVEGAIEYEIQRQTEVLESGKNIIQETRGWDDMKGETYSQREKESSHDYRYFPEPDLPPFRFSKETVNSLQAQLPAELPQQKREKFKKDYYLEDAIVDLFVKNKKLGDYFESVISELSGEKSKGVISLATGSIVTDLQGFLTEAQMSVENIPISPRNYAELVELLYTEEISSKIAKMLLPEMLKTNRDPKSIIKEKGLSQIVDTANIENIAKDVITKNPKAVEDFKKGKQNALQFLVGQLMAKTKGKASPDLAQKILGKLLE